MFQSDVWKVYYSDNIEKTSVPTLALKERENNYSYIDLHFLQDVIPHNLWASGVTATLKFDHVSFVIVFSKCIYWKLSTATNEKHFWKIVVKLLM